MDYSSTGRSATAVQVPPGRLEARLLVVEDEPTILELLSGSLRFAGFDVRTAASGREALRVAAASRPDLIMLDVMLPDGDGFDVIRAIRGTGPRVPVIFLTARSHVHERVAGLTLGGDDYVTKPFSPDEVLACIRAVLRPCGAPGPVASRLIVADLELDEDTHEVRRHGTPVTLTPTEFKLLRYLMINGLPLMRISLAPLAKIGDTAAAIPVRPRSGERSGQVAAFFLVWGQGWRGTEHADGGGRRDRHRWLRGNPRRAGCVRRGSDRPSGPGRGGEPSRLVRGLPGGAGRAGGAARPAGQCARHRRDHAHPGRARPAGPG
jgi:two-component system OmpR family response regulator